MKQGGMGKGLYVPSKGNLIFPGHLFKFSEGKDRSVLAHILIPDIASATDADTTLHAHLKRKDDPLGREPQFL